MLRREAAHQSTPSAFDRLRQSRAVVKIKTRAKRAQGKLHPRQVFLHSSDAGLKIYCSFPPTPQWKVPVSPEEQFETGQSRLWCSEPGVPCCGCSPARESRADAGAGGSSGPWPAVAV